jgi:hypothetical protein
VTNENAEREARNNPVAARKIGAARLEAGGLFGHEAAAHSDQPLQFPVLRRINDIDAAGENGDSSAIQRRLVRCSIDTAR